MPCDFTETGDAADSARSSIDHTEFSPESVLRVCIVGGAVRAALASDRTPAGPRILAEAASGREEALQRLARKGADVLLFETGMDGDGWESFLREVREISPATRILAVAPQAHAITGLRALQAGAHGYLSGENWSAKLREALETVAQNRLYLTGRLNDHLLRCALREEAWALGSPVDLLSDRELEVLEKLGRRRGVREVALELRLSVKTVETHRSNIARKLGLDSGAAVAEFGAAWLAGQGLGAPVAQDDPVSPATAAT